MLAPAVGYGASGEHESFPGTVSIGTSAAGFAGGVRSASKWASRIVFVNGHGGNVEALAAMSFASLRGREVGWSPCAAPACRYLVTRNICIATYFTERCATANGCRATARRWPN